MSHEIGLYVHIPFCKSKCFYCDFNSYASIDYLIPDYIEALKKEIFSYSQKLKNLKIITVFFGGGTPSILEEKHICDLMRIIKDSFNLSSDAEITLESNPGTLSTSKLRAYKRVGINRISIGLQAWQDRHLKNVGRIHDIYAFVKNFEQARVVGFQNINVDLLFGLPGQSMEDWIETVKNLINLRPQHISAYSLIIEENTPLSNMIHKSILEPLSDELDRRMYHYVVKTLQEYGYEHYEISNFALPGYECKHNLIYWETREYLGVGAGAHSYLLGKRFGNETSPQKYIELISTQNNAVSEEVIIDKDESIKEYMILGFRLAQGINPQHFEERFGQNIYERFRMEFEKLQKSDLIEFSQNSIRLTPKGLDFANQVFIEFI